MLSNYTQSIHGQVQGASREYGNYAAALQTGADAYARSVRAGGPDPLAARSVEVNGRQYSEREVLAIARDVRVGDADAEPFLNEARHILRRYGYRTGALGNEGSVHNIADPAARMLLVRGDSNSAIAQLQRSADVALEAPVAELNERYGVEIEERRSTSTMTIGVVIWMSWMKSAPASTGRLTPIA